jgi:hypothetical protein
MASISSTKFNSDWNWAALIGNRQARPVHVWTMCP